MEEIFKTLEKIGLWDYTMVTFGIWLTALAVVYVLGRMTGIVESWRTKNIIALVILVMMSVNYVYTYRFLPGKLENMSQFVYNSIVYWAISSVLYTLLAMRLWDRVDKFLDRRLGKDSGDSYKKTDRRRRHVSKKTKNT